MGNYNLEEIAQKQKLCKSLMLLNIGFLIAFGLTPILQYHSEYGISTIALVKNLVVILIMALSFCLLSSLNAKYRNILQNNIEQK